MIGLRHSPIYLIHPSHSCRQNDVSLISGSLRSNDEDTSITLSECESADISHIQIPRAAQPN
jgi:hypothetical protein